MATAFVCLLGAYIQVGDQYRGEWETVRRKCWAAFHLRRRFWRLKGFGVEKMRMLHMSIWPVLNWCAGGRYWNRQELQQVYSMMLQMSRRALNLWPYRDEEIKDYLRRTVHRVAKIPRWDQALLASWWRYAGHIARLAAREPDRWISKILTWRDAAYRRSVRGLLWRSNDPTRQRVGRGSRHTTARRWDDPLQHVCGGHTQGLQPWQVLAQDKTRWAELETVFLCTYSRRRRCAEPPRGRFMIGETP